MAAAAPASSDPGVAHSFDKSVHFQIDCRYCRYVPEYGVKPKMTQLTIGQLAAAAGVNVETVRYYHRRGLLPLPQRATGSIGRYAVGALTRLRFIRRSHSDERSI